MTEYSIVIAVIGCACIGGIMLLVQSLRDNMLDLQGRNNAQGGQELVAAAPSGGSAPAASAGPKLASIAKPGPGQQQICTSEGWCVNVPVVMDGASVTDATGAQGIELTEQYASVLDQVAQQVANMQDADPSLKGLIADLAKSGHTVADKERAAYNYCPPGKAACTDPTTSSIPTPIYGMVGDAYTVIGYDMNANTSSERNPSKINVTDVQTASQAFSDKYKQLQAYLEQHPNALPPEIQNIVATETGQIQKIAGAYDPKTIVFDSANGYTWKFAYDAKLTDQSADTICGTSGEHTCYVNKS